MPPSQATEVTRLASAPTLWASLTVFWCALILLRSPFAPGRLSISKDFRVNERIRVREVRVIGEDGEQLGVMPTFQALELAQSKDLDLVEVAPNVVPPVCRLLDYGRFKYEQTKK